MGREGIPKNTHDIEFIKWGRIKNHGGGTSFFLYNTLKKCSYGKIFEIFFVNSNVDYSTRDGFVLIFTLEMVRLQV